MRKFTPGYICSLIVICLVGCQKISSLQKENIQTSYPSQTPVIQSLTINSTSSPTLTALPDYFTWSELQDNVLFIFHDGYLTLYNLKSHLQAKINYPIFCRGGLVSAQTLIHCNTQGDFFLLNPITKTRTQIQSDETTNILRTSPDGEYLLISEVVKEKTNFYAVNIHTKVITNFPKNPLEMNNLSVPILSKNAEYAAYISPDGPDHTKIITLNLNNDETQEFLVDQGQIMNLFNWSSKDLRFIVGASDLETDMPGILNMLYLVDPENKSVSLLSKAEFEVPYEYMDLVSIPNIWSPNGEEIVIPTPVGLCRIIISEKDQLCVHINDFKQLISIDWSTMGDEFVVAVKTKSSGDRVYWFSSDDMTIQPFDDFTANNIETINWR